ncbi:MAG TPA: methyltransferase domain-containing protein [Burkholderiales bacterium]|nr:methyltransferase domain-containing protein [Burkholderiales bacterium]
MSSSSGENRMTTARSVETEWLDVLPAEDPRAIRSRLDLHRVNKWMGNAGIMQRALLRSCTSAGPGLMLELGAGDGRFTLELARRLAPRWKYVKVVLLDCKNIVTGKTRDGFAALGWQAEAVTADAFDFLEHAKPHSFDAVTANLFLHHFQPGKLARLLTQVAQISDMFVACEPRRSALALAGSKMLWAIGCNAVSRHDAVASVRAGFTGQELSELWPGQCDWRLNELAAGLFTHCFTAQRTTDPTDVQNEI